MLQAGTLIAGRYELQSPLASGGNGLVYAALDRTTEKRVAIKILGQHMLHERSAREKMRLEAIVAGRVESEHIVQVSDAGVDVSTGVPFLVMELLKGQDLQHHVEQRGRLELVTALEYLRQVASGLDKAHGWKDHDDRAAPIVHRDLKPENLFLTHREDGSPLVKILDFGLAKVLSVSATLSTEIKGTPLYMAPEQLSQAPVTPATDIWALGLIAFFLFTGKSYWLSGQDERAILPAVIKEVTDGVTCPALRRLGELGVAHELPESFDDWFAQCVNVDPTRRFNSAGRAIKALGAALDQPLVSSPMAATGIASSHPNQKVAASAAAPSSARLAQQSPMRSLSANASIDAPATDVGAQPKRAALPRMVVAALVILVAAVLVFSLRREQPGAPQVQAQTAAPSTGDAIHDAAQLAAPVFHPAPVVSVASELSVPERPEATPLRATASRAVATPNQRVVSGVTVPTRSTIAPSNSVTVAASRQSASSVAAVSTPASATSSRDAQQTATPIVQRPARDPADHR